jgi:hypothetical protein
MRSILLLSCGLLAAPLLAPAADVRTEVVEANTPELIALRDTGAQATAAVGMRLVTELTAAMQAGGPLAAVEVCHLKALPLTEPTPAQRATVTALKRTSLRLRNPANRPDAAEADALTHVASLLTAGKPLPAVFLQRVNAAPATPAAAPEWRVYRPVMIQPACLACHGDPAKQPAELRALLAQKYPADTATGYDTGEWRGLIRATLAQP